MMIVKSLAPDICRGLVAERFDEVLFKLSYDYVGDLAETIAAIMGLTVEAKEPDIALPGCTSISWMIFSASCV